MLSREALVVIFSFVAALTLIATLMSLWALWNNVQEMRLAHGRRPALVLTAWSRIFRDAITVFTNLVIFLLALGVLLGGDRRILLPLVFITFFDYPLLSLYFALYDRWLRRRLAKPGALPNSSQTTTSS